MTQRKLTPKQDLAVREYLKDLSWKKASERSGLSYDYIRQLVTKPHIKAILDKRIQQRAERVQVTADMVLSDLWAIWQADIKDIVTDDWKVRPLSEWPKIWRQMTSSVEVKDIMERSKDGGGSSWDKIGEAIKTRTADKLSALVKAGEHVAVKAFPQKESTLNINVSLEDVTERLHSGRERARQEEERVH